MLQYCHFHPGHGLQHSDLEVLTPVDDEVPVTLNQYR